MTFTEAISEAVHNGKAIKPRDVPNQFESAYIWDYPCYAAKKGGFPQVWICFPNTASCCEYGWPATLPDNPSLLLGEWEALDPDEYSKTVWEVELPSSPPKSEG